MACCLLFGSPGGFSSRKEPSPGFAARASLGKRHMRIQVNKLVLGIPAPTGVSLRNPSRSYLLIMTIIMPEVCKGMRICDQSTHQTGAR
jgi:hypothetical protein